jgi:amidase
VRDGELSARELVGASLERIEALDGELNAFVHVDPEGALAAAEEIRPGDGRPFAGVPIAIKDNRPVAGMPLTFGATFMPDLVPPMEASIVRRLRDAGFVIVGKTALPEWGIVNVTESTRNGPTRNPWDLERTPGGSSGGAAAAVAAGMLPIAHGNDGGGSTRIPAACCGLVGLKPARGRISLAPFVGDSMLAIDGMLTRTVAETAALLDLLAGYEPGDATWAPPPAEPFAQTAARPPARMRIGFTTEAPLPDAIVDPVHIAAVEDAAALLSELGHDVEPYTPPWAQADVLPLFTVLYAPLISSQTAFAAAFAGREPTADDMEALSWMMWELSRETSALEFNGAVVQLQALARQLVAALEPYDALLTPTLAERPVPIGTIDCSSPDPRATFRRSGQFTPHTAIANLTGLPAISLPIAHGDDGLPTAIQLIGSAVDEGRLLALSAQLEEARPWADRRPQLAAA